MELFIVRPASRAIESLRWAARNIDDAMGKERALAELGREIRDSGLVEARSSGMVLLSGRRRLRLSRRRPGRALRPARTSTRCISTTGLSEDSGEDERACRQLCAALRHRPARRAPRARGRQPPGRRPRGAVRGRRAAARPDRGRLGGDRAHPHRPRRDDGLPARRLARAPRAARAAGAPRAPRAAAARHRPRGHAAAGCARPGCRSSTTPRTSTRASRATGSAPRCCRCCASSAPRRSATWPRPGPSSPRRRACSSGWRPSCSPTAARDAAWRSIPAEALAGADPALRRHRAAHPRRARRRSPRSDGPAAGRPRSGAWPSEPEGGEVELGGGLRAVCELGLIRFATPDGARARGRAARASRGSAASAAGRCSAERSPGARPARQAPSSRRSTPTRSGPSSSSARGATATGCARSAWRARRRCRTCSRTARCPRSLRAPPAGGRERRPRRLGGRRRGLRGVPARRRHARGGGDQRPRGGVAVPARGRGRTERASARSSSPPTICSGESPSSPPRSAATTRAATWSWSACSRGRSSSSPT